MKGDFTRGHRPDGKRHQQYRRVLLQEGRVVLDSDIAAGVDAVDHLLRDLAVDVGCERGSPNMGYLVTPGPLLALFTTLDDVAVTGPAGFVARRDYAAKYQDRFPSLYLGAQAAGGSVSVRARAGDGKVGAPAVRIWARAKISFDVTIAGKTTTIPANDAAQFKPYDVSVTNGVTADFSLTIVLGQGIDHECWIGLIEAVEPAGAAPKFWFTRGRYYLQGLAVECAQDGEFWASTFPSSPDINLQPGDCLVAYLEGWERLVTHIEDRGIQEQALGGILDTTARTRAIGQVKVARFAKGDPDPAAAAEAVAAAFEQIDVGTGKLVVTTKDAIANLDPCAVPEAGGYTGTDNRLYRFEVHDGGALGAVTIKWSKNNGSDLFAIAGAIADALTLAPGAEVRDGDLIELLHEVDDLGDDEVAEVSLASHRFTPAMRSTGALYRAEVGDLGQIKLRDLAGVPVSNIPPEFVDPTQSVHRKLRVWHGLLATKPVQGTVTPVTHFELGDGVVVDLSGADFRPGDYWQYEARALKSNENGAWDPSPHGPERLFAPLALLKYHQATAPLELIRWYDHQYSPLCELDADDIAYDNAPSGLGGDTVQEAIDELARVVGLRYVGGDGQEALPGATLPYSLRVRLTKAAGPVVGARVRFKATTSGGALGPDPLTLSTVDELEVSTGVDGYAECFWRLSTAPGAPTSQDVVAVRVDDEKDQVRFAARLSVAGQVGYTPPEDCATLKDARTVQEAIDALCAASGTCELVVRDTMSMEAIEELIERALKRGNVKVCFAPGDYRVSRSIFLRPGKGRHLVLSGAGEGSRIRWGSGDELAEATFSFERFDSVTVRDLHIEGGTVDPRGHLSGVLTFVECARVHVEAARIRCREGDWRGATCITVRGSARLPASVRILRCRLEAGNGQIGALVIDAARAQIEDNIVDSYGTRKLFDALRTDRRFASAFRDGIVYGFSYSSRTPGVPEYDEGQVAALLERLAPRDSDRARPNQVIPAGVRPQRFHDVPLSFLAPRVLAEGFDGLLDRHAPPLRLAPPMARRFLRRALDKEILASASGTVFWPQLHEWIQRAAAEFRPVAAQGIVVAGEHPVDCRIVGNTIAGVLQGIHVGWSREDDHPASAARVLVTGNTVSVSLRVGGVGERHGIFVGNSRSTVIEHNHVTIERGTLAALVPIEGIHVYGILGPLLMVRENHIEGASTGILAYAINALHGEPPPDTLWRVGDNVAIDARRGAFTRPPEMVIAGHPNLP